MRVPESLVNGFFASVGAGKVEIYNEFSLQHELGVFLRDHLGPGIKVQFERPISFFGITSKLQKREIDIAIFENPDSEHVALELKYPRNGQYPEQMFKMCEDVRFIEQLVENGFSGGYAIIVADDPLFYEPGSGSGIYEYFRSEKSLTGRITKPTGKKDTSVDLDGQYAVEWLAVSGNVKYALIEVGTTAL